ncbi:acyl carrier protein [Actinosynnema sp. CS-041913]|uniref:acyl carrier protein n=1 Tax=Actinosynnema sp. CS-041913 TaxID=3239917 RepID=UPI003D8EBDF3
MRLTEVVGRVLDLDPAELTDDSSRDTILKWTSMHHVKLLVEIESAYGIRFSNPEMASMQTIGDVRASLLRHGAEVS